MVCHALSIEFHIVMEKMIKNSKILSKEQNINNVLSVNFGFKEYQDVVLWHAVAGINFVMIVVEVIVLTVHAKIKVK